MRCDEGPIGILKVKTVGHKGFLVLELRRKEKRHLGPVALESVESGAKHPQPAPKFEWPSSGFIRPTR